MVKAIVFDFDGLILDTEVPDLQSWQEVYRAHGCDFPEVLWARNIGTSSEPFDASEYLDGQLGCPVDREAVRSRRRQRFAELVAAQSVLPGVEEYVADAGRLGVKLAVASSSSRTWVTGHLARLGLAAHFDCIKSADDVAHAKPNPALYHAVLDAMDLRADQAVALEDSPNGVLAAKRAGLFCVAVPNAVTRQLVFSGADLRLNSLADVPLEKLLAEVEAVRSGRRR